MPNENIIYTILAGTPELIRDVVSAQFKEFTVPADEKWWVLNAGCVNSTQTSRSEVKWSVNGTDFTGFFISSASPGAGQAPGDIGVFPFMLPPGGKITTGSATFTASDGVIHTVTILKMFSF